ncbi:MAG: hypothetical protein KatS3mg005_1703 [Bryobacteraceae bacterium]|nr:MAG: hypothetical protein KatS3mg005_1703 [Bryobacteraceae bacterium]
MRRTQIPAVVQWSAAGLAVVAVIAAAGYWLSLGSQARLEVQWLKVRTIATGPESSLAVFDIRIHNPSRVLFQVKEVEVSVIDSSGSQHEGLVAAQTDLDRVLGYFPLAGPRYNPVLMFRERIRSGETADRTVAASFSLPAAVLESRRSFQLRIHDADGAIIASAERPAR